MALADTPFSIRASEVQFFPLAFVKNKKPWPDFGIVKEKFTPTFRHPFSQLCGLTPPPTPWIMIFGSLTPSAKAITDPTRSSKAHAQIWEIFIEVFLFTKGISLGNLLPASGGSAARVA